MTIHSGRWPDSLKASMILSRLPSFLSLASEPVLSISARTCWDRGSSSTTFNISRMASAPMPALNRSAELFPGLAVFFLGQEHALGQIGVAAVHDHVRLEIEDLLQLFEGQVQEVADLAGQALQKPDVHHRAGQLDVAHPFPPHLGLDHLDAAFFAGDPPVLHTLVFAAVTFVILGRSENLGAEQAVPFRFKGPVVDGLRLFHLAERPVANHFAEPITTTAPPRWQWGLPAGRTGCSNLLKQLRAFFPYKAGPQDLSLSFFRSSTLSARLLSSRTRTLKDSGSPASKSYSPLKIFSYMRVRPATSSDFTVRNSCRV